MSTITTINATDKPRLSREVINTNFANLNASKAEIADVALLAGAYANPSWITSLAWAKITGAPVSYAPSAHTHPFSEITGTIANAQVLSGAVTQHQAALALAASQITSGALALARGGTGADLSATGGANQVLKQTSAGGVVTVAALVAADIPSLDTAKITTGTFADARIAASNVTQHQAALSIASSQVTGTFVGATKLSDYSTAFVNSITGTPNQVIASASVGGVTLSLPQSIHTAATPTFAGLTVNGNVGLGANQALFTSSGGGSNFIQGNFTDTGGTKAGAYSALMLQSRFDDIVIQAGANDSNLRSITLRSGLSNVGLSVHTSGRVIVGTTADDGISRLQVNGYTSIVGTFKNSSTGIGNGARPGIAEWWASAAATPTSYARHGGIIADMAAGAKADFGVFSDGVPLTLQTIGSNGIRFWPNSTEMMSLSSAGTLTLYNPTATTGVTSFVITPGAAQGANPLLNADATGVQIFKKGRTDVYALDVLGPSTASGLHFRAGISGLANGITVTQTAGSLGVIKLDPGTGGLIGFFGVTPVARPAALTAADASALTSADATVIANMRTRINEIESKLQLLGLLN